METISFPFLYIYYDVSKCAEHLCIDFLLQTVIIPIFWNFILIWTQYLRLPALPWCSAICHAIMKKSVKWCPFTILTILFFTICFFFMTTTLVQRDRIDPAISPVWVRKMDQSHQFRIEWDVVGENFSFARQFHFTRR